MDATQYDVPDSKAPVEEPQVDAESKAPHTPAAPVAGLAFPIQLKVAVGSASDPAELEAERVAASVVGLLRRSGGADAGSGAEAHEHGSDCGHDHGLEAQRLTDTRYDAFPIRRHAGHDHSGDAPTPKKKKLQRLHDGSPDGGDPIGMAGGDLSAATEQALSSASSGGRAIDPAIRGPLEGALGADLSAVRLHAGPQARDLNRSMSAQAFTHGANVFFRDGMPDTGTDAGLHLLSHELTHTVQQGAAPARRRIAPEAARTHDHADAPGFAGAIGGIRRRTEGPIIRRHAAFEHYMLGQLPPRQLAKIPAVRSTMDNKHQREHIDNGKGGGLQNQDQDPQKRQEVIHLLDMEMERLLRYRDDPEALNKMAGQMGQVTKGKAGDGDVDTYGPGSDASTRDLKDTEYNVPIVVLRCSDGEIVVSYSEMNTMPDLFGNPEAITKTPKANVLALLQGVRQQLYIELSKVRDELQPPGVFDRSSNKLHNRTTVDDDFQGAQGPRAQEVVGKAYEIRTEKQVNTATTRPGDENEQYFSALERNACHFAPQSWSQWEGYHEKALAFARESAWWKDMAIGLTGEHARKAEEHAARLANEAMIQNSFGEHYLQDSFASGHLIDKTKIMQWFTLWLDSIGHQLGSFEAAEVEWAMAKHAAAQDLTSNPQALHDKGVRGEIDDAEDAASSIGMQSSPEISFMIRWRDLAKVTPKLVEMDPRTAALQLGVGVKAAGNHFDALVAKGFATKNRFGKKYALKKSILNDKVYDSRVSSTGPGAKNGEKNAEAEFNLASYKALMSNAYIGASTKFFHDMFCKEGLEVETEAGISLGRIYGDSNMMNAGGQIGLEWSAETARMSRDSLFDTINGEHTDITSAMIARRFPKRVKVPGTQTVLPIVDFNNHLRAEGVKKGGLFEEAQDKGAKLLYKTLGFSDKGALDLTKLTGEVDKQKTLLDEMPF